jgi:mRNA interferase RelE/StbE
MKKQGNNSSEKGNKPAFEIVIKERALKQLSSIPKNFALKIDAIIQSLASDPYPHGNKKLQGYDNIYRIRYSDYRIIYAVENKKLLIEVIQIGDRKEIYKKL